MKPEEFEVYVIPPNFMEGGTLFGGLLKTRNTVEAVILGLAVGVPVLHLPFSLTVRVVILCLTALPLVLLALIGVSGMSLSAFIRLFFCFLHNRRILSRDGTQGGKNGKTLLPSWAQQRKSDCEAEDPPLPKSRSRFSVDLKQRSVTQFKTFLQEEEAVQPLNALADYIPIEKIEHGVIYTRDHRYVKVVEVVPVNFLLRSAREQRSIIYSFISYLKIAPVKVQFKALTKRADINRHLDTVRKELEHEQDPRCRVLQEDYLKLIRQLGSREAITRRFFLIFEYEPLPGTKRGHEEEDAIASLQTAARTAANYLRQCCNEVISPENEDDATAEILYNILCRRASSEPFYQRVKSVLADYMAAGRDINTIPVNEFYAPDSIDLTHGNYLCVDGLYYAYLLVPSDGYKARVPAGWLSLLVNAGDGIDLDVFLARQPKDRMVRKLGQQLRINRSKIKETSDTNTDFNDLDGAIRSGYFLKDGLSNNEDFYYLGGTSGTGGTVVGEYKTSSNGTIVATGLKAGTYVCEEISAPDGYVITDATETVYLSGKDQDVITVTFGNDRMGSLLVVKKDAVTGAPISDVEFFITDSDGSVIGNANGKYVTDSAGTIRIDGLTPGMTVIAKEVRTKEGYILDDTPQSIKIKRNAVMTLEFRNQPRGGVLVKKVDAVTNAPISDVEFFVTDSDGNLIGNANGKFVTDSAGTFTLTDIAPGTTLVVKETRAKAGYILDDTPQTVKVKSNEVVTVEFRNQPKGNLIIVKQDSVTKEPLEGVEFKITYADGSYVDAEGGTLSSTGLYRTDKAGKITISGISGTVVVAEIETIPGYTIDENSRTQTVAVNPNDTQTLYFYNTPIGGVEIIKVNEDNHSERIPNTTFEIRKVDDALVDTVTTDKNGRVFVPLKDGSYYAKEVTSNKSFRLDDTPHYFEIKDGKHVTLQVTNKKLSGIVIHKIDSATGEGIYGVKFVLYDANKKPIGEYTSDDEGYIYIDEIPGGLSGRFYLRELEAAPGYTLDKQYKTVYVSPGKTVEIEWENTAVTGQIQIYKYAAEYNEVTGTAPGTPLKGAVYEIVNARSGKVVDYITTDARGVAASKPLPLTRYQIREVTAPAYWQLDPTVHDVTLEYPGQIIKLSAYDKPASLGVTITKRGNAQVMAGQSMRYDLTVANTSNVPLESFFWHDKIPYDVARPTTLTTGTYSARLNYRILYKTNYNASYQVLASNLLTGNNYSFSLNAIPMQAGEVVTDIYFDFGKVPVGFQSVVNPTLSVMVNGNAVNGYQMVNRADVGGKYQGTWQTATASWVTIIRRLWNTPTLPKTGY